MRASDRLYRLAQHALHIIILAVSVTVAAPLQAQDCPRDGPGRGDGDDIRCKMEVLLGKNAKLLGTLEAKLSGCTDTNCEKLHDRVTKAKSLHSRAMKAHGRTKAEDYKDWTRKKKKKEQPPPEPPPEAQQEEPQEDETDFDVELGADLADQLDDASDAIDRADGALSTAELSGSSGFSTVFFATAADSDPPYEYTQDPSYPTWLHVVPSNTAAALAMLTAKQFASAATEIAGLGCQQDAFGFNVSTGCVMVVLVSQAVEATSDLINFVIDDTTSWEAHGAYVRSGQAIVRLDGLQTDIDVVTGSLGDAAAAIAALQQQFTLEIAGLRQLVGNLKLELLEETKVSRAYQRQIMKLLLTPEGKRAIDAGLLTCTGGNCPEVLTCSPGQCTFPLKEQ